MAGADALSLVLMLAGGGAAGWLLRERCGRERRTGKRYRRPPSPGEPWPLPADQLRQWLEALPQGWLVLAPDGTLSALNPRAEQLLELQRDLALPALTLLGQPLTALSPSDDVLHLVALARDKGLPQRGRWPRPEGDLELRVLPGSDGWVGVLLEGRNPLQRQLQRQEAWVGDVAHELRTPITALMLVGDSLAARLEGQPQAQRLVERLQKELRRLQELVSDLLALSRLENTPVAEANRQSAVDPRDVLGSVWAVLEPLASQRGVGLHVSPGRDQARLAAVDPARLHQALLNLLDNALGSTGGQRPGAADRAADRPLPGRPGAGPQPSRWRRTAGAAAAQGLTASGRRQVADHQLTLIIDLQPALLLELTEHPGHGDAGGAQGAGDVLMGEAQVEAQALLAGLAVVLSEQLEEAAHPILDAAQTKQGDQGLRLAHAAGHRLDQHHRQVGCALDLLDRQTQQVAISEGDRFVEINVGERLAERFIGAGQTEHQIVAVLRDAAELHHAAGHQPEVIAQQRHTAASSHMHEIAALVGVFEAVAQSFLAAGSEDHRAVVRRLAENCMEQHRQADKAAVVLRLRVG